MSYKHPVVLITSLIVTAPIILHSFEHGLLNGLEAGLKYLFSPVMIASYIYLYVVVAVAHVGTTVPLSSRDKFFALWFLMNGMIAWIQNCVDEMRTNRYWI
jgi:hypothetical protein